VISVTLSDWDELKFTIETLKESIELRADCVADKTAWTDAVATHKAYYCSLAALRARASQPPGSFPSPGGGGPAVAAAEAAAAVRARLVAAGVSGDDVAFVTAQVAALGDAFTAQLAAERRRRAALRARVRALTGDKAQLERTVVAEALRAEGGAGPGSTGSAGGSGRDSGAHEAAAAADGVALSVRGTRMSTGGRTHNTTAGETSDDDDAGGSFSADDLDDDDELVLRAHTAAADVSDAETPGSAEGETDEFFDCAEDGAPGTPKRDAGAGGGGFSGAMTSASPQMLSGGGSRRLMHSASSRFPPPWGVGPPPPALPHGRRSLPRPAERDARASLWTVIKDAVGRDLTRITLPVAFNEPLSALQKFAEEVEYSELLDAAAAAPPRSVERLLLVTAFAVSGYSSADRRLFKPFNPLERETYEYVAPERGVRFLAEKVRHHPLQLAAHASGRGWTFWGETAVRTKFWGRAIELLPSGSLHATFADGDTYAWRKAPMLVSNIILGPLAVDYAGVSRVVCLATGDAFRLRFKEAGLLDGGVAHAVKGVLERGDGKAGKAVAGGPELAGTWNGQLFVTDAPGAAPRLLWRRAGAPPAFVTAASYGQGVPPSAPFPPGGKYNFGAFAVALNEPPPPETLGAQYGGSPPPDCPLIVCPTDSRLRPDQRLLEQGRFTEANTLKLRLEDAQRVKRKVLAEQGLAPQPRWFRPVPLAQLLAAAAAGDAPGVAPQMAAPPADDVAQQEALGEARQLSAPPVADDDAIAYAYVGGYWEARERRDWSGVPRIFDAAAV
jgi:hypothetical protein